jgi:HTH-type transcriptional regulator / antitoxin HigA
MKSRGTKQVELFEAINLSKNLACAIINGKREISKTQAKKLGTYSNVSPAAFI